MPITLNGTTGIQTPLGSAGSPVDSNTTTPTTGVYYPSATTWGVSTAGTNALYIDASQNVGIGTTSPGAKLHVYGSEVRVQQDASYYSLFSTAGSRYGYIQGGTGYFNIVSETASSNNLTFTTSASERMRIDSSGNVGIGTTSPGYKLDVNGQINAQSTTGANITVTYTSGAQLRLKADSTNTGAGSATNHIFQILTNNTNRARFDTSGNFYPEADNSITCGANGNRWSAIWAANGSIQTSDLNAKKDIIASPLGLDFINNLRPVAYKFKIGRNEVTPNPDDPENPTITPIEGKRQHFGLIAQEVKAVIPEGIDFGGWVLTDLSDINSEQGLRYEEFISPLIKAIQELKAEFDAYKAAHP